MAEIELKYSEGDKIWIPARVTYAEIHEGKVYYHISEDKDILVAQESVKKRKDNEIDF